MSDPCHELEGGGGEAELLSTSIHLRRALSGDQQSWTRVIERLSPLLRLQAKYRLGKRLMRLYDPEDLVHDVWIVALCRFPALERHSSRLTPVLVKYLSTILVHRVNDLIRKHVSRDGRDRELVLRQWDASEQLERLPSPVATALTQAARSDVRRLLEEHLKTLRPDEQQVLILCGIEQLGNGYVATLLGERPSTVAMRYRRALEKLRRAMPGSVFDELE